MLPDEMNKLFGPAAQDAARIFSPYCDASDILNDLWIWTLENSVRVEGYINDPEGDGKLRSAISQEARKAGQKYKAQACGYSVDDVMQYSTKAIEALLPDVFDYEDWQSFGLHGDGQPTAKVVANSTGDRLAEISDILLALKRISERNYNVLVWRFKYEFTQQAIAEELGISQPAVQKSIGRAIRNLQKELGAKPAHEGLGTRRIMSNAAWQATTSRQWEGE